jgi:O-antigen/teichoic acid export membrane protein
VLTLAMLAPGLLFPIVVAERISPETNAYWYVAWMIAGLAMVIPSSMGAGMFAELANTHANRRRILGVRASQCIRSSLLLGVPAALLVSVLGDRILALLGESYRDGATLPLRVLVWAVVPAAFVETYVAACRVEGRLGEAVGVLMLLAACAITGAAIAAPVLGIAGVASGWLVLDTVVGGWAAWRVYRMARDPQPAGMRLSDGLRALSS